MATEVLPGFLLGGQHTNKANGYVDQEDDELGVGTSSGASFRTGGKANGGPLSFNYLDLIKTPIKWVKGKERSVIEIPYEPINIVTPSASSQPSSSAAATFATSPPSSKTAAAPTSSTLASPSSKRTAGPPPTFPIISPSVSWVKQYPIGRGLENEGNTCYLNSALQVLLHTAPLVRVLDSMNGIHGPESICPVRAKNDNFCMACALVHLKKVSFEAKTTSALWPKYINTNLKKIAKHLRKGRQEDSHEFLRFVIDALQASALHGTSPKLEHRIKESTYVHQIFGGRLRSRVKCTQCDHPSDTFDSILDLSLDVNRHSNIRDALKEFVHVDMLKGANKYKCESCKRLVVAEKSFTIDQAPLVLSIHMKRFRADGRKNNDQIGYHETLDLSPYMSDSSTPIKYRLYGVVHHSGGGPHSGHYYAHVRDSKGRWHEMNDSIVSSSQAPLNKKTAYMLFYCREQGDLLSSTISSGFRPSQPQAPPLTNGHAHPNGEASLPNGLVNTNANGKRRRESDHHEPSANGIDHPSSKKPFTGPHVTSAFSAAPPTVRTAVRQPVVQHVLKAIPSSSMYPANGGGGDAGRETWRSKGGHGPKFISTTGSLKKGTKAMQMKGKTLHTNRPRSISHY